MSKATFPGRLKELRLAAGLTQDKLAELAGLSRQGVCNLEAGRKSASLDSAHRLARALKCTVDDLGKP